MEQNVSQANMDTTPRKSIGIRLTDRQEERAGRLADQTKNKRSEVLAQAIDIGLDSLEQREHEIRQREAEQMRQQKAIETQDLVIAKLKRRGEAFEEAISELEQGTDREKELARRLRFSAGD